MSCVIGTVTAMNVRIWVYVIQEASSVVFVENACKSTRLLLERLHVLDFDDEDIARLCCFDFEWPAQVVHSCQINILHIIRRVVVANLAAGPIYTLDLHDFTILDSAVEGD